jgi:hypothetical protein
VVRLPLSISSLPGGALSLRVVDLKPEVEAELHAQAAAAGLSLEKFELVSRTMVASPGTPFPVDTNSCSHQRFAPRRPA